MTLQSTIRASSDQVSSDLNGEAAILNLKSGVYFGLDPVGSTVWRMLAKPTTIGAVRDAMLSRYEVEAEQCERDLLELLTKLSQHGLVTICDAS